jgi:ribosomal-protein-alanine N-acetyltransferase
MRLSDLDEVATVEKSTLSPWSIASLASECRITNGLSFVAVGSASKVLGWCGCRIIWPEAELLKIAVAPEVRGVGVGRLLLEKVIAELRRNALMLCFSKFGWLTCQP